MKTSPADLDRAALIIQLVCRHFSCAPDDLETKGPRAPLFDWPRYVAIHLINKNTALSLTIIGELFNRNLPETIAQTAPESVARNWNRIQELNHIAKAFTRASASL